MNPIKFKKKYSVIVAGGGIAGCAAALDCARNGLTTALIEKTAAPGGLATTGLVYIYLPLCDGYGAQVTFGIAEELLLASIKYGPGDVSPEWKTRNQDGKQPRYRVAFSPASFVLALDELLVAAGVDIWFDTLACLPVMAGSRITGVEVENKSGRGMLEAACVIDATGDADLAFRAGAPCVETDNWLALWAVMASKDAAVRACAEKNAGPLLDFIVIGGDNAGQQAPENSRKYLGASGKDVSSFLIDSRALLRNDLKKMIAEKDADARKDYYPLALAGMPQLRTTRRIEGRATVADSGYGKRIEDSIGMVADWRKSGFVWEMPYGALLPKRITGLLVSGRCISSERDAWEVTRVIPAAALTGQAAGVAATLAVKNKTLPDTISIDRLQNELRGKRMPVHLDDVGLK